MRGRTPLVPREAAPPRSPSCTAAHAPPPLLPLLQKEQQWKGYQSTLADIPSPYLDITDDIFSRLWQKS